MAKMSDQQKTRAQLIKELQALRQQVIALGEPEQQRRQTEQALRESEEKYRAILENIEEAYYETDLTGRFTFFNDALCKMLGYARDKLMGMNYRQYMDEETAEKAYHTFNTVYRTGEFAKILDWEIIKKGQGVTAKDGARRDVAASVSLMIDLVGGEPIGFRGIVRDVTERKRDEAAIVKLNRELTALNEVGQALISVLDLQETLAIVTDLSIRLMGVEAASVILRDKVESDLWFAAASGEGADFVQSVRLPLGQGIAGWVVQHGEPIIVPDVSKDARFFDEFDKGSGLVTRSILCVPLQTKGQVIGAIEVMNKESGTFHEEDLRFLASIAASASTAIENAHLFEQSRIQAEELAALNKLSQALTARLDVEGVLEAAYRGAARLVDTTNFYIGLYDAEKEEVTVPFMVSKSEIDRQITTIPANEGLTGYIVRNRASVLIEEDVLGWLAERGIEQVGESAHSWLGAPLMVGDQVLGVMAVQSYTTPRLYGEHDRDLLTAIAGQTAIAVQNARFFQAEQEQRELAEALEAAAAAISSTLHFDQVLDRILEQVERVVPGDAFSIELVEGSTTRMVRWRGYESVDMEGLGTTFPIADYPNLMRMLQSGKPAIVPDTATDPDWLLWEGWEWVRSYVGAPIQVAGETVAFLNVDGALPGQFVPADARRLQSFANQAAAAIQNARLYEQAQREIAERKRMEESLRESEGKYRVLVNTSVDGIISVDSRMRITLWNRGAESLFGYTEEEMLGQVLMKIVPERYREAKDGGFAEFIKYGSGPVIGRVLELEARRKDGTEISVELSVSSREVGGAYLATAIVRDITERKRMEESLRESEERSSILFSSVPVGIVVIDAERRVIVDANSVAVEMIGVPQEQIVGSVCHNYICPAEQGRCPIIDLGQTVDNSERVMLNASGESVPILKTVTSIMLDGRKHLLESFVDITERKRTAEELQKAHEELGKYATLLERQTEQLQAGAEVAREVSAILDARQLLDETVRLISREFDFYHVAAFMVGEPGEYAILQAASSEGGRRMLERGYRAPIGETSVVGQVAATGEYRIALDVGANAATLPFDQGRAASFDNPDLPDTRSEICLPLRVRGRTIGVLDIQSTQEAAFSEGDVAGLQTMADQLSVSIENAHLVERTASQLREKERLYGDYSAAAWADLLSPTRPLGYVYDRVNVLPVEESPSLMLDGAETTGAVLSMPLKLRGQTIGILGVQEGDGAREWSPEEIAIVEAVSDQVAMALDSARLFGDARTRAEEMVVLNELAQSLAVSLTVDEVLEETFRGVSQLLDTTNFYVGLYDPQKEEISFPLNITESVEDEQITVIPANQGYAGYIVQNSASLLITEDTVEKTREKTAEMGIERVGQPALSYLGAPLLVGDRVLGVVAVQDYATPHVYDERDRGLLTAIASQTAIALQSANLFAEVRRRATQLAAAAEVARDATAILDVDQLLDETAHLISEQFGYYHAGVFLLDEQDEYAVLQAVSSEGGRRMLERGHKLRVGKVGIVGHAAATGEPRVALDVGLDATHFAHGDLPDTRSEMGLPLKVRGKVIGVLDVQSEQAAAFSEDDVSALQTMADQLAIAIANARLFQEARADVQRRALISEMLQAAATSLDMDELLHRAGETISGYLNVPSAVFAWDMEEQSLRPVAFHTADAADILLPEDFDRVTRKMNAMLFDTLKERRTSILDATDEVSGPLTRIIAQAKVQSVIYVPLASRAQELGVLGLGAMEGQPLVSVEFAELLAANLSVAMENARLFQEAVHTAERLAEVDRLKSQFLANMSHELRTPLNSIIGFSRVILKEIDGPITEMQRTDLQAVYDSGQHLLGLINDILEVSKIEAGKMEMTFETVNLQDVIKGVLSTAIALVKDKPGIKLQQAVPKDLPTITGDTRRIRQAILNLVSNAAKFTEEGFIRVEAKATDSEVIIAVVDSGIGISPDKLETIFEPFTQADASTTREFGGTGLGLSITSSFVEVHGGRMWVESELGKGATFYMALPISGPALPEEQVEEQPETELGGPSQKVVLCVEDDEGVITLFRRYLDRRGYRVVGLTDAAMAVERARELEPFAITLDVMMPGKDGWQVIQELKADPETAHIPVIMCTIVSEKEHGLSLGAVDYLLKPILEQDLLAVLNRLAQETDGRHLVLVVDDQPGDRELLRRILETQEGYEVIEADGGQEAIALIRQTPPHIIILDLMMPHVDGFAVLEAIKMDKATRSIPIIVVTAKDLTLEEQETLNSGVASLLQKGIFEQQELLADVAAALDRMGGEHG